MSRPTPPTGSPFTAPAWIAVISVVGLVSALLGNGVYDVISWLVFSGLIGLVVRAWVKRTR